MGRSARIRSQRIRRAKKSGNFQKRLAARREKESVVGKLHGMARTIAMNVARLYGGKQSGAVEMMDAHGRISAKVTAGKP